MLSTYLLKYFRRYQNTIKSQDDVVWVLMKRASQKQVKNKILQTRTCLSCPTLFYANVNTLFIAVGLIELFHDLNKSETPPSFITLIFTFT